MEGVLIGLGCLRSGIAPDSGGTADQVTAIDIVACVKPLPGLLVFSQSGVQTPLDSGPVQVHQLLAIDT